MSNTRLLHSPPLALLAIIGVAAIGAMSCSIGSRASTFRPAHTAEGVTVVLDVTNEAAKRKGELFAVDSIGITVFDGQLSRFAWSRVQAMDVVGIGYPFDISFNETVTKKKRERLAVVSRFPAGLSGPVLQEVLRKLGAASLEEVR